MRLLVSAGEASGEMYGAQLIAALCRRDPQLEFFGVGGGRMRGMLITAEIALTILLLASAGANRNPSHNTYPRTTRHNCP